MIIHHGYQYYGEDKTSIRGFFRGFRSRFSKKPRTKPRSRKKEKNLENSPKPRTENLDRESQDQTEIK